MFKKQFFKIIFSFLIFSISAVVVAFCVFRAGYHLPAAIAGASQNVNGWAWSDIVGWISFNNLSGGGSNNYGVHITDNQSGTEGNFSGYAWSDNIGWLSFNESDLGGCPAAPCRAWVDKITGQVKGWAKFLTTGEWLSLRGSNYGVSINKSTGVFSGWAWGDETAGWVSFNCEQTETGNRCPSANYKVQTSFSLNTPPRATNLNVAGSGFCSNPLYTFSWVFEDADIGDSQSAYQLQVDKEGTFTSFGPGEVNLSASSNVNNVSVVIAQNPNVNQLDYQSTKYYWRVKVWDSFSKESAWANGPSFTTPAHPYPLVDFTFKPSQIVKDQVIQFCSVEQDPVCPSNVSVCYGNNYPSCASASFQWVFPAGVQFVNGTNSASPNPAVKFSAVGKNQNVQLTISDDVGSCSKTKSLNVNLPLPKWKEVSPQ